MSGKILINIVSNYTSRIWNFIAIYVFTPIFLKYFGIESFAIISFYALILGTMSFADAGLSSAITREFAKSQPAFDKFRILKKLEYIYVLICFFVAILIFFIAPLIAKYWLKVESTNVINLIYYIRLIGIGVSFQLLSTIYFGSLMGLGLQVYPNSIQLFWSLLKNFGIVIIYNLYKIDIQFFFIWQIICNIIYVLFLRVMTLHLLKKDNTPRSSTNKNKILSDELVKYIFGMSLISIISALNIQADKIIISKLFALKEFGYYSLASTIAQIPLVIATPLSIVAFPDMTKKNYEKKEEDTLIIFERYSFAITTIVTIIGCCLLLFTKEVVLIWLGEKAFSIKNLSLIVAVTQLLLLGGTFLSLQLMPYYLLLSKGLTKFTIIQGVVQLCFSIPASYFFITRYGILGIGFPWLIINFGAFIFLYYILYRDIIKKNFFRLINNCLIIPCIVNILISLTYYMFFYNSLNTVSFIVPCILLVSISLIINVVIYIFIKSQTSNSTIKKIIY